MTNNALEQALAESEWQRMALQKALEFMLDRFEGREGNLFSQRLACSKARDAIMAQAPVQESAHELLWQALLAFQVTQEVSRYPDDHWSQKATKLFLTKIERQPVPPKAERLAELQREIADLMAYDEHTDHLPAPLNGVSERDALAERIRDEIKQLGGTF